MQEVALLMAIETSSASMLARCFQKYYAVSDDAATELQDGDVAATESPAPVLHQAVMLAGICAWVLSSQLSHVRHLYLSTKASIIIFLS